MENDTLVSHGYANITPHKYAECLNKHTEFMVNLALALSQSKLAETSLQLPRQAIRLGPIRLHPLIVTSQP